MCDYSLKTFPNRLARDGEELLAHRFPSGCTGFISTEDLPAGRAVPAGRWSSFKAWLFPRRHYGPAAVCVPPGSVLVLDNIASELRFHFDLAATEEAIFVHLGAGEFSHRDGLQFRNGKAMLLQLLPDGQRALVRVGMQERVPSEALAPEEAYA